MEKEQEKKTPGELSFEEALSRLEEIVSRLESGELSLQASLNFFEEGIKLSRFCSEKLKECEHRVQILLDREDGEGIELKELKEEADLCGEESEDA